MDENELEYNEDYDNNEESYSEDNNDDALNDKEDFNRDDFKKDDFKVTTADGKQSWDIKEPEALYDYIVNECR